MSKAPKKEPEDIRFDFSDNGLGALNTRIVDEMFVEEICTQNEIAMPAHITDNDIEAVYAYARGLSPLQDVINETSQKSDSTPCEVIQLFSENTDEHSNHPSTLDEK